MIINVPSRRPRARLRTAILFVAAFAPLSLIDQIAWSDAPVTAEPKRIESFTLKDHLGANRSLSDWKESRAVVVTFVGTECPLARHYGLRLAELSEKYAGKGVQFVAIDSNQQDSLAEITQYVRAHQISFPVLKDLENQVADQFDARRTPETFVLDKHGLVRYRGRIDDQYGVGYARSAPTARYLEDALDDLLADRTVRMPVTEAKGCHIGRVNRREPTGDVTYTNQIAWVFNKHCIVCHREGQIAPFALTTYADAVAWSSTIREVVAAERMPPWSANPEHGKFKNDPRLSAEEKSLIDTWIENGLPEGDPAQLPPPSEFAEGWRIPKPDLVVKMPQEFKVPAKGIVEYQHFTVDPGFKEDVWVRASEGRPGNRSVVHHLIVFYLPPGQERSKAEDALFNSVASFVPGAAPTITPEGLARRIPAGSKLVFQMHYTPNGTAQSDQSEAGFVFVSPDRVRRELLVGAAFNFQFLIPPGAKNHKIESRERFSQDVLIHALIPHMHLRGKSFRFAARTPDKLEEILLEVPRYDFNWQHEYVLAEPKLLTDKTEIECVAHFDNSSGNPSNPNPRQTVFWGDQTYDEMMIGSYYYSRAEQDLALGPPRAKKIGEKEYEVLFRFKPPAQAEAVYLAGSFNEWKPSGRQMQGPDKDGFYTSTEKLPSGSHEYKFVIDGKIWKQDPGNRDQTGYYHNSVITLGE